MSCKHLLMSCLLMISGSVFSTAQPNQLFKECVSFFDNQNKQYLNTITQKISIANLDPEEIQEKIKKFSHQIDFDPKIIDQHPTWIAACFNALKHPFFPDASSLQQALKEKLIQNADFFRPKEWQTLSIDTKVFEPHQAWMSDCILKSFYQDQSGGFQDLVFSILCLPRFGKELASQVSQNKQFLSFLDIQKLDDVAKKSKAEQHNYIHQGLKKYVESIRYQEAEKRQIEHRNKVYLETKKDPIYGYLEKNPALWIEYMVKELNHQKFALWFLEFVGHERHPELKTLQDAFDFFKQNEMHKTREQLFNEYKIYTSKRPKQL